MVSEENKIIAKEIAAFIIPILLIAGVGGTVVHQRMKNKPQIGVINVYGPIQGFEYADLVNEARDDDQIKGVVLKIDSPGGGVYSTFQTESAIRDFSKEKPIIASLKTNAASGAYIIASAADNIYAYEMTTTGSLGVRAEWISYKDYYENKGIHIYRWESKDQKTLFDPLSKPTENDKKYIQNLVEELDNELYRRIKWNRPEAKLEDNRIQNGLTIQGYEALELNLIDNYVDHRDPIESARKAAGLEEDEYEVVNLN